MASEILARGKNDKNKYFNESPIMETAKVFYVSIHMYTGSWQLPTQEIYIIIVDTGRQICRTVAVESRLYFTSFLYTYF